MNHPYRILVTNGGARYCAISLLRVTEDCQPVRANDPRVEKVIMSVRCPLPRGVTTGVSMPERPNGPPSCIYDHELRKVYEAFDQLVAAPMENYHG